MTIPQKIVDHFKHLKASLGLLYVIHYCNEIAVSNNCPMLRYYNIVQNFVTDLKRK